MAGIIISKIKYFSFAKFIGVYTLLTTFIYVIVDLVYKLFTQNSIMYGGTSTWGSWILYSIITLIAIPILAFVTAYIFAFLVNLVLKWIKGLEFETL